MPIPSHRSAWNDERVSLLCELSHRIPKLSYRDMAQQINEQTGSNYSRNAICGKHDRLKLPARPQSISSRVERSSPVRRHPFKKGKIVEQPLDIPNMRLRVQVEQASLNIPIWDLAGDQCKYPVGPAHWKSHTIEDGMACGHTVKDEGMSYCKFHSALCHNKPPEHKRTFIPARGSR